MAWSEDQIERLRASMALAHRSGAWICATEARLVLDLIANYRRATLRLGWNGASDGPLPTIGDAMGAGVTGLFVECARPACRARRRFSFEDLGLDKRMIFVEVERRRRFRCVRCGGREVTIMADWPDPIEAQRRRMGMIGHTRVTP